MEQPQDTGVVRVAFDAKFEKSKIVAVQVDGRTMWSVHQIGRALGYVGRNLANTIGRNWSDELEEGVDYTILTNGKLKAVRSATAGVVPSRAPSLMMLTESGVHLVALLSRKPAAKRLRRWLAEEVLPSIRQTGQFVPPTEAPVPTRVIAKRPERLTGASSKLATQIRGEVAVVAMTSPLDSLMAFLEMLQGTGIGGARYCERGGMTDAELRKAMKSDVDLLPASKRDELARWLSVVLGRNVSV